MNPAWRSHPPCPGSNLVGVLREHSRSLRMGRHCENGVRLILSLLPGVLLHTTGPRDPRGSMNPSLKQRRQLGSVNELFKWEAGMCCLDPNLCTVVCFECNCQTQHAVTHASYTARDLL